MNITDCCNQIMDRQHGQWVLTCSSKKCGKTTPEREFFGKCIHCGHNVVMAHWEPMEGLSEPLDDAVDDDWNGSSPRWWWSLLNWFIK